MKLKISSVKLKNSVFISGTNFPNFDGRRGEKLTYDNDNGLLIVEYMNQVGMVPISNIASMMVASPSELGLEGSAPRAIVQQPTSPQIANIADAQVSTPYGHVHQGLGAGQTGQEANVKKGKAK